MTRHGAASALRYNESYAIPEELIDPRWVTTRNDPIDGEKVIAIQEDLQRRGWRGRPLVLIDVGGALKGITGSHRIYAARSTRPVTLCPALVVRRGGTTPATARALRGPTVYDVIRGSAGWDLATEMPVDGRFIAGALRARGMRRLAELVLEG